MKSVTILAVSLGLGALAACNSSPQEQKADNIEANAENVADNIEANADNSADVMQANAENTADMVRNQGEQKADTVRNSADADGNSANLEPGRPHAGGLVEGRPVAGRPFRMR